MAAAAGVEPATCSLGESRSIQLSYATASCAKTVSSMKQCCRFLSGQMPDKLNSTAYSKRSRLEKVLYTIVPFRRNSS